MTLGPLSWLSPCHIDDTNSLERYGRIMRSVLDLNIDMGESVDGWRLGEDRDLLRVASSVNVCTGAYAGTLELIAETCFEAVTHGVRIGAQVGYRDPEGFGRRPVEIHTTDLQAEIAAQLDQLASIVAEVGGKIAYVKPHGALYHRVHHDPAQAEGLISAIREHDQNLLVMGMPEAVSLEVAQQGGLGTILEGFADRGYGTDGLLIARDQPDALIEIPDLAAEQALRLAPVVDSLCVHSDSPGALALMRRVRDVLETHSIVVGSGQ